MLTDLVRDHAFTIAWFGLMTLVWLGWAQEDPPPAWRPFLGAGSVIGLAFAGAFGFGVFRHWADPSALEGRYPLFGVLTAAELVAAGIGCVHLWRTGRKRWMAWWVAIVVALHFIPLALLVEDLSLVLLGVVQLAALAMIVPRIKAGSRPSSWLVGPVMGVTLLLFAVVSAGAFVVRHGLPW